MKFLINGADNLGPSNTVANYNAIVSGFQSAWGSSETARVCVVPIAMILRDMYVEIATAPGAGKSWVLAVVKNGVATGLAVTISDTATTGSMVGAGAAFAAGDTISIESTPSGTPASMGAHSWSIIGETSGAFFPVFGFSLISMSPTEFSYVQLQGTTGAWSPEAGASGTSQIVPLSGTIRDLYVKLTTAPGAGKSYAFRIIHNSGPTGPEVVISDSETSDANLVDTVAVSPGDRLLLRSIPSGTPASSSPNSFSFVCVPNTPGESFIMFGTSDPPSTTATEYEYLQGDGTLTWSATESTRTSILAGGTAKAMYVLVGTVPGVGADWTFTLRKEAADTALSVVVAGLAQTGNDTEDVVLTPGDSFNWECTPSAIIAPATMTFGAHLGLKIFFPPEALVDPMRSGGMVVPYERSTTAS